MSNHKAIFQLPIVVKLLLPLLSILLGVWTIGTFSVVKNYLQQDLIRETEDLSMLVLQDLEQKQELLRLQARWVADKNSLSQAMASKNRASLLQTLLPIQAALQLDLIQVIASDGSILVDLRQGEISQAKLLDEQIRREASIGIEQSEIISAFDQAPSLLAGLISVKSEEKILGGVIIGSAITDNLLQKIRGKTEFQIVALRNSQVIASTLPSARTDRWQAPLPQTAPKRIRISTQEYFAKTNLIGVNKNTNLQIVLLKSVAPLEQAEQKLWLSIGGFCLIAGGIAFLVGIWISRWLRRRIQTLTLATQALASGDLDTRIPVESHDEVGILAQGFNFMAEQLTLRDQKIYQQMQELKQTQAQLIQSEKMSSLGLLVAGIAHEINNPTSFIRGNLSYARDYNQQIIDLLRLYQQNYPNPPQIILEQIETLELDFLIEDLSNIFSSMETGCRRISDIVLSLRNFSRLDEAEFKCVDIHEGIESTLMILAHSLKQKTKRPEITIIRNYDNLPLIECYPGELNQVFLNILSNAIDILDEGIEQPQIHIRTQLNYEQVAIYITDNGAGISEEIVSKVFDPFFTTKPIGQGTGLGLSICYQIVVDKHGGKIHCHSQPGKGTEFVIEIPVKQTKK